MKFQTLYKKLLASGYDADIVYFELESNLTPVIRVKHDYDGLYPTNAIFNICNELFKIATRYKYQIEHRGYYTASFIW